MPQEGLPEFPEQIGFTDPPISDEPRMFSLDYLLSKRHKRFPRKLKKKIKKKIRKAFWQKVYILFELFWQCNFKN